MEKSEAIQALTESEDGFGAVEGGKTKGARKVEKGKARLPLARVRHIMKMDPDCKIISQDAVFLTARATEMFIEMLSREMVNHTNQSKRKTVLKRDLEKAVEGAANLCFLDGMLEATT